MRFPPTWYRVVASRPGARVHRVHLRDLVHTSLLEILQEKCSVGLGGKPLVYRTKASADLHACTYTFPDINVVCGMCLVWLFAMCGEHPCMSAPFVEFLPADLLQVKTLQRGRAKSQGAGHLHLPLFVVACCDVFFFSAYVSLLEMNYTFWGIINPDHICLHHVFGHAGFLSAGRMGGAPWRVRRVRGDSELREEELQYGRLQQWCLDKQRGKAPAAPGAAAKKGARRRTLSACLCFAGKGG